MFASNEKTIHLNSQLESSKTSFEERKKMKLNEETIIREKLLLRNSTSYPQLSILF